MQPDALAGKTLGQYIVEARIGGGGMGQVYRALEPAVSRQVAIKVLPPALTINPEFVERFRREARIVASLMHPNILPIFTFGEQDGILYLVMPYVTGGTLEEQLRREPEMAISRIVRLVTGIAAALEYAHGRGVVHRDLKPANVMLDEQGHPLVVDFGIARILQETGLTQTGAAIGTPGYMSPEQGLGQPVDGRSDIYALGIILYQLLAGRLPFTGDTPHSIIFQHIYQPPAPLSAIRPGITPALEQVVMTALAKKPEERFQTARDFADALTGSLSVSQQPTAFAAPAVSGPTQLAQTAAISGVAATQLQQSGPAVSPAMPAVPAENPQKSGPRKLPLVIGGLALLLLVLGLGAGAALRLRGDGRPDPRAGGATGATPTQIARATTPAPATPVPATPGATQNAAPVASPPALTSPSPATSPSPPAGVDPRLEVWAAAQRANELWREALNKTDSSRLAEAFAGPALADVTKGVADLAAQGRYRVVEPIDIDRLGTDISGDTATIRTFERWRDRVYLRSTNALIGERNPWVFRQTYTLQRINGQWKVVDNQIGPG